MVALVYGLVIAWMVDRLKHTYAFAMLGIILSFVGNLILLNQDSVSTGVQYFACFLLELVVPSMPVIVVWLSNVRDKHIKVVNWTSRQTRTLQATTKDQLPLPCKLRLATLAASSQATSLSQPKLPSFLLVSAPCWGRLECAPYAVLCSFFFFLLNSGE
jgi:hypothetical protein